MKHVNENGETKLVTRWQGCGVKADKIEPTNIPAHMINICWKYLARIGQQSKKPSMTDENETRKNGKDRIGNERQKIEYTMKVYNQK